MEGRPRHSNIGSEKYTLGHYVNEYNKMTLYGLTNLFQNVAFLDIQS